MNCKCSYRSQFYHLFSLFEMTNNLFFSNCGSVWIIIIYHSYQLIFTSTVSLSYQLPHTNIRHSTEEQVDMDNMNRAVFPIFILILPSSLNRIKSWEFNFHFNETLLIEPTMEINWKLVLFQFKRETKFGKVVHDEVYISFDFHTI